MRERIEPKLKVRTRLERTLVIMAVRASISDDTLRSRVRPTLRTEERVWHNDGSSWRVCASEDLGPAHASSSVKVDFRLIWAISQLSNCFASPFEVIFVRQTRFL